MNKNSVLHHGAAVMLATLISAGAVVPAFAAEGTVYTPVTGANAVVEKYLVMDKEASVPNVTFNYTITPGAAQNSDGNTTLKVFAGNDANAVAGSPTISNVTFAAGDATYTKKQTLSSTVNTQKKSDGKTDNLDNVTLNDGQKYARHDINVDFSGVSFKEPGVYRYVVHETASDNSLGIVDDKDLDRIMDVYVVDNAGKLQVEGYVLHNTDATATIAKDGTSANATKAQGFVNSYVTHDLTIGKTVAGNQASHDEYFKFTVDLQGGIANTVYQVDLSNADATTKTNAINTSAHKNASAIRVTADGKLEVGTSDDNGKFTADPTAGEVEDGKVIFWLQNGQSVKVQGLANNTAYSVSEDATAMDHEGYDPSVKVTGDTQSGDKEIAMDDTTYTVADDHITADTNIAYTNTKSGVIPTGILTSVGTAAMVSAIAVFGMGAYIVLSKKKKESEE